MEPTHKEIGDILGKFHLRQKGSTFRSQKLRVACGWIIGLLLDYDNVDERLSLLLLKHKNMRGTAVVLSQGFRLPICVFMYLI